MASTLTYVGPFDAVEIAATGQVVAYGETVVIEDPDLADNLSEQDCWEAQGGGNLAALKKPELVELAEAAGLDTSGTKAQIIERLQAAKED
jgi:hypothetical protein